MTKGKYIVTGKGEDAKLTKAALAACPVTRISAR